MAGGKSHGSPAGGAPSDVQITKTASTPTPSGGATFSYALTVRNNGPGKAKDVVAHDTLPLGVTFDSAPGCSVAAAVVTCDAGDLANGASKTFQVNVIANPIGAGAPVATGGQAHNLTIAKVEAQVDLDPGQTKTVQVSCPGAGIVSDGSIRVDAVDQGTGALTDVHVRSAQSTGIGTWEAVVSNGATGRAQAKAFAVCLPARTESADGHDHALVAGGLETSTHAWGPGRQTATVGCPGSTMAIAPGFAFAGGSATVVGSEPTSAGWSFTVDVTATTTATLSVRCLDAAVATAQGHTHALATQHVVRTVTIGAGQTVEEQVTCADDAKGIVGTWTLPAGVVSLGNDPRPKTRAYKLVNPTGSAQTATVDLECLRDRVGSGQAGGEVAPVKVDNTATVTTASTDPTPGNDSATASVTVQSGKAVASGATGQAGSSTLTVKAVASVSDKATITVKAKDGTVWASGPATLTAGQGRTVKLDLTKAGESALGSETKRGTCVIESSAGSVTRKLTIRPA